MLLKQDFFDGKFTSESIFNHRHDNKPVELINSYQIPTV